MTLDEAIIHEEEVAEANENLWGICPASESGLFFCDGSKDCISLANGKNKGCLKCAAEHRQLAEWLKDYKRLLKQEPVKDMTKESEIEALEQQPKIGHWIIIDDCELFMAKCSECGEIVDSRMISKYPYCHCGTRMIELQESEK